MSTARATIQFETLMADVAARLLGEPNHRLSKPPKDVRYGTGVIVGIISMTMAVNDCDLAYAIGAVRGVLVGQQQKVDRRCIPDCWRELWPT